MRKCLPRPKRHEYRSSSINFRKGFRHASVRAAVDFQEDNGNEWLWLALLIDPSILILDEATSAVDAQSESMIHQCLGDFVKGHTVFLITHAVKPVILEFVSRIVVMEQGQVLAVGSHDELLQSCSAYQRLFRAQISGPAGDCQPEIRIDGPVLGGSDVSASIAPPHVIKFEPASNTAPTEALRKAT